MGVTEEQQVTAALRKLKDPRLADLYAGLLRKVREYNPGAQDARFQMLDIGHYAREFMNRLPEWLGADEAMSGHQGSEVAAAKELARILSEMEEPIPPDGEAALPPELLVALEDFRLEAGKGSQSASERASLVVCGAINTSNPAVKRWSGAKDFFIGWAHMDSQPDRPLPTREAVTDQMECVTSVLFSRLGRFFDVKRRLKEILDAANALTPDRGWPKPTQDEVEKALRMLNDWNLRVVFYSELANPEWLGPLERAGALRYQPQKRDGQEVMVGWPESVYLERMAGDRPEAVTRVLLDSAGNEPVAQLRVIQIAVEMPVAQAARVGKAAVSWLSEWEGGLLPGQAEAMFGLTELLLTATSRRRETGEKLFVACFRPRGVGVTCADRAAGLIPLHQLLQRAGEMLEVIPPSHRRRILNSLLLSVAKVGPSQLSDLIVSAVAETCAAPEPSPVAAMVHLWTESLAVELAADPEGVLE